MFGILGNESSFEGEWCWDGRAANHERKQKLVGLTPEYINSVPPS